MELGRRLSVQTKKTIAITPRVIQSIKLLKCNHDELCSYLKEQEERNPLIDVVLPETRPVSTAAPQSQPTAPAAKSEPPKGGTSLSVARSGGAAAGDLRSIEETFARRQTLREHLLEQVDLTIHNAVDRLLAREIVESLDPDGYLRRDLDEIADVLGIVETRVEHALHLIQGLEPTGVGARDLGECLRLQLDEAGELTDEMDILLDNLDMLAKFDLAALARLCGVDRVEIAEMARQIRMLDPRPGRQFDTDAVLPAMPDVNVELRPDGTTHVELNSALLPKVLVNREYYSEMRAVASGENDVRFVTDCMRDANWLARNLDQRANTMLKVATEIVKRQQDFLLKGVEHIKPLCQADVADAIGMHRSTVCRAISGKYLMTNRGLFELKYFFSNALSGEGSAEDVSAESIRARIRKLIEGEQGKKVLSDDAITATLKGEGVNIARRTVAKYREMMNIPPSSIRRRQHSAARIEAEACVA
ncbi:RNA polymerase factor sigma-54 [Rhodovulum sp. FJ3]|uniref:RNA polymerase factor sigma-54 n=1 Tax=Rhodovulum sp. FJ3 TaxID=3079053 RepID=UPI00293DE113|nr:RNA polymerase factor sigma-54 [Rhodovulum sp. FJ3]MDV4168711.1 RNA polymerase factor sigma-54 [Rhodovulum sp. FJ3]